MVPTQPAIRSAFKPALTDSHDNTVHRDIDCDKPTMRDIGEAGTALFHDHLENDEDPYEVMLYDEFHELGALESNEQLADMIAFSTKSEKEIG